MNEAVTRSLLCGSQWIAKPDNDSYLVAVAFGPESKGDVTLGFGQTLYFIAECHYRLHSLSGLEFTFDRHPQRIHRLSRFTVGFTAKIPFVLDEVEYEGSVCAMPFKYRWRLRFERPPFPDDIRFPRPIPTEFYGYDQPRIALTHS